MLANLKTDIRPISYIKTNAADMMKYVNEQKSPIIITQNGEAKAVLVDIESYQETQTAFNLLRLLEVSERQIEKGDYKEAEAVFADIERETGLS